MCLIQVDIRYAPPLRSVRAWKIFIFTGGRLIPEFYYGAMNNNKYEDSYKEDQWYEAMEGMIIVDDPCLKYPAGFHGFMEEKTAKDYLGESRYPVGPAVAREVELQEVHTRGVQTKKSIVYVAKRMRILPQK